MRTQSIDTNPEVEKIQIDLLRKAGTTKRLALTISLSDTTIALSKRAIKRANPELSQRELDILFVKYHYGVELANKVREYFIKNNL